MVCKNRNIRLGFTLVELLVTVLIIGILVAIAIPQYQYAVAKANMVTLQTRWNTLEKALQVYFLMQGTFPLDVRELEPGIWAQGVQYVQLSSFTSSYKNAKGYEYPNGDQCGVYDAYKSKRYAAACANRDLYFITLYPYNTGLSTPDRRCGARTSAGERICKTLSARKQTASTISNGLHAWYLD